MWEELLARFESLVAGTTTREAEALWARGLDRSASFAGAPDHGLAHEAWATLRGVTCRGESLFAITDSPGPEPYFIRDEDVVRWLNDLSHASAQVATPFTENVVTLSGIVGRKDLRATLRGVDGLDFFERWELPTIDGRLLLLEHHSGTAVDHTSAHLDLANRSPGEAVADALATLKLSETAVSWRSPRFFKPREGAL